MKAMEIVLLFIIAPLFVVVIGGLGLLAVVLQFPGCYSPHPKRKLKPPGR